MVSTCSQQPGGPEGAGGLLISIVIGNHIYYYCYLLLHPYHLIASRIPPGQGW